MNWKLKNVGYVLGILTMSLLMSSCGEEADEQEAPIEQARGHVADLGGILTEVEVASLEQKLAGFEQANGVKFILYTEDVAPGGNLTTMGQRLNSIIPIGSPQLNQGLAILIARQERQAKIEVNHGLEWQVPDSVHAQIFANMVEYLKADNYAEGLSVAFEQLFAAVENHSYVPETSNLSSLKSAGNEAVGSIVGLSLTLSELPQGSLAETQFSPDFRLAMQATDGTPVNILHTRYMESLTDRLTQPGRKSEVYGRVIGMQPITLQLMGVE